MTKKGLCRGRSGIDGGETAPGTLPGPKSGGVVCAQNMQNCANLGLLSAEMGAVLERHTYGLGPFVSLCAPHKPPHRRKLVEACPALFSKTPTPLSRIVPTDCFSIPLFGLIPVLLAIIFASQLYAAIAVLNAVLLLVLVSDSTDFSLWFVVYELSVVTGFSALLLESRTYRRFYAFTAMFIVTGISSTALYALLNSVWFTQSSAWVIAILATILVSTKIPMFPFSLWLPEAHVEASWPGSIVLASFALKFSSVAVLQFLAISGKNLDAISCLLVFSVMFAALAMATVVDAKKLIANFSVVHMSVTVFVIFSAVNSEFLLNFSWHHHSVVTGWVFALVGISYAASGSRLFRLLVADAHSTALFCLVFFTMITVSLDMPWTANVAVELAFVRLSQSWIFTSWFLFSFFWSVIGMTLALTTSKSSKVTAKSSDITATTSTSLLLTVLATIVIGFATSSLDSAFLHLFEL